MDIHTLATVSTALLLAATLWRARMEEETDIRHPFFVDYAEITRRCSGTIIAVTVGYSVLVVVVVALVTR